MEQRRQIISITLISIFLVATIGLLWWSRQPMATSDAYVTPTVKKERKLPAELLADPRFQTLRSRNGTIDIGTRGNTNPFEPFK